MSTSSELAVLGVTDASLSSISSWSDQKKSEFVSTFHQRSRVSRYLLRVEAARLFEVACNRKFLSEKHTALLNKRLHAVGGLSYNHSSYLDRSPDACRYYQNTVGGRECSELDEIARARAANIIKHLPTLITAVRAVSKSTANKIAARDKLKAEAQRLHDELTEVSADIVLSDLVKEDPNYTIAAFLSLVEERKDRRDLLALQINKIAEKGNALETEIAKDLYAGLPGLSEAIMDLIAEKVMSAAGLETAGRRVEELVKFGDSAEALAILQQFEKDERTVEKSVADKFRAAMATLKQAGAKTK